MDEEGDEEHAMFSSRNGTHEMPQRMKTHHDEGHARGDDGYHGDTHAREPPDGEAGARRRFQRVNHKWPISNRFPESRIHLKEI